MALGSWEPNFTWDGPGAADGATLADFALTDITALYECIKVAFGPAVTMDETRQDRSSRRKTMAEIEETTNDGISYQAAKMTKCIVNYMASGSDKHIIDYEFDFELDNVLVAEMNRDQDLGRGDGSTYTGLGVDYMELVVGSGWFALGSEDVSDIDLDWDIYEEINYLKAPITTISIGSPPPGSDD